MDLIFVSQNFNINLKSHVNFFFTTPLSLYFVMPHYSDARKGTRQTCVHEDRPHTLIVKIFMFLFLVSALVPLREPPLEGVPFSPMKGGRVRC